MSSILEALKKLEEEKAAQQASLEDTPEEYEAGAAAEDIFGGGRKNKSSGTSIQISPAMLLFASVTFGIVTLGAVVAVILLVRPQPLPPMQITDNSLPPLQSTPADHAPNPIPETGRTETPIPSNDKETDAVFTASTPDVLTAAEVATPALPVQSEKNEIEFPALEKEPETNPEPIPTPSMLQEKIPNEVPAPTPLQTAPAVLEAVAPQLPSPEEKLRSPELPPEPEPVVTPKPQPEEESAIQASPELPSEIKLAADIPIPDPVEDSPPSPPPAPRPAPVISQAATNESPPLASAPIPDDIRTLPILTASDSSKFGIGRLQLNVMREADANHPNAHAIINLEKVYTGETIPGTSVKLIEVKSHGIAIELAENGNRYYLPH